MGDMVLCPPLEVAQLAVALAPLVVVYGVVEFSRGVMVLVMAMEVPVMVGILGVRLYAGDWYGWQRWWRVVGWFLFLRHGWE